MTPDLYDIVTSNFSTPEMAPAAAGKRGRHVAFLKAYRELPHSAEILFAEVEKELLRKLAAENCGANSQLAETRLHLSYELGAHPIYTVLATAKVLKRNSQVSRRRRGGRERLSVLRYFNHRPSEVELKQLETDAGKKLHEMAHWLGKADRGPVAPRVEVTEVRSGYYEARVQNMTQLRPAIVHDSLKQ